MLKTGVMSNACCCCVPWRLSQYSLYIISVRLQ